MIDRDAPDRFQDQDGACIDALLTTLAQRETELKRQLALFSGFLDALPNPIFVKNEQTVFIACNRAYEQAFGIRREDFIGKTVMDLDYLPLEDREAFQQADIRMLAEGGSSQEEIRITFADGMTRTALYHRQAFQLDEGRLGGLIGLIVDISRRKRTEEYERFRSRILEMMVGGADLHVILRAIVSGIEQLYPDMLGCIQLLNAQRTHLGDCIAPSLPESYTRALNGIEIKLGSGSCGTSAATGQPVIVENIQQHPYWVPFRDIARQAGLHACWSQPIRAGASQEVLGAFAVYHRHPAQPLADELQMMAHTARLIGLVLMKIADEEKIRQMAFYDPLTQLPNRRLLNDRLSQTLLNSRRTRSYAALLLLDLDNFKPLNDLYGHAVGDQLLIEVARRLKSCVRETDTVSRLGGDEFVVILNDLGEQDDTARTVSMNLAEKIRQLLIHPYQLSIADEDQSKRLIEHQCSSSIGIVVFCDGEQSGLHLLRQADRAMYRAKQAGKNQVCLTVATGDQ